MQNDVYIANCLMKLMYALMTDCLCISFFFASLKDREYHYHILWFFPVFLLYSFALRFKALLHVQDSTNTLARSAASFSLLTITHSVPGLQYEKLASLSNPSLPPLFIVRWSALH